MSLMQVETTGTTAPVGSVGQLLESGIASLDITAAEHQAVESRYQSLGAAFEEHWEQTRSTNTVFPQGSFRLGTVTRRIHHNDDVDIDLVATRDLSKDSISQQELKMDAGHPVRSFAGGYAPRPEVHESDRCWTLNFAGMHMDVLPALDEPDGLGGILITDRAVRAWQRSHPRGYAEWFHSQVAAELNERRQEVLAKNTDIEDVPDFALKSDLQRVVQALKRHRDIYFKDRLDDRPSSIIITTLAARAYAATGRADLYDSLRNITKAMPDYITFDTAGWQLANPVQPEENFADYWNVDHRLRRNFEQWLDAAIVDFDAIGIQKGLHNVLPRLRQTFGERAEQSAARAAGAEVYVARTNGTLVAGTSSSQVTARQVKPHGFYGG
ncbi:hypothetical protein ABH923_000329 [Leifsonia sp. EB41]|uniref:nucleotidyltransferase domain-containing protein n=1 Tax=Leifsonia sp. EB41 TaxID=3156260 RepID=UPI0035138260